jgi:hypothetical protein
MTRLKQKQCEIFYAECFSKDMNLNWIIEPAPDEENWPDLIVETCNQEIFGLEVRNYFKDENSTGSSSKRNESHRQTLLRQLSSRYYEKRNRPIHLKIGGIFSDQTIEKILDVLFGIRGNEWEVLEKEIISDEISTRLLIRFLPDSMHNYSRWIYLDDNIGWVKSISDAEIEKLVKLKSKNVNKYKQNIDIVSLLIVADRISNSGRVQIEHKRNIHNYGFNKVYFYIYPSEAVIYESHKLFHNV